MKIILLAGKARAGKDITADFIQKYYEENNMKVCRLGYGAYIKYYASKYFGWDGSEETKPRELLQTLGTEIIRKQIDPYFHVNRIIEDIKVLSFFFDIAIISDVREPIEITTPKEKFNDVLAIKITRPNYESELTCKEKGHYTETALDRFNNYDYEIINDGTLDELNNKVIALLEKQDD